MRVFHYEDLGVVQRWTILLLFGLVFYNDPLYAFKEIIGKKAYKVCLVVFQSTFIALILFFWIFLVHSIAQVSIISSHFYFAD